MHCTDCGTEASEHANFCSVCGYNLKSSRNINIESGNNSVNFGQQNKVTGNTININSNEGTSEKAYIDRTKIKPLSVAGTQLKASWLIISGLLGILGSLASILGFIESEYHFIFFLTLGLGAVLFPIGITLVQTKHLNFPPFFNLETGSKGELYFTKIEGSCPKCTGKLKLRSIGSKSNKITVVRCTRNHKHMWDFDPTVLSDL